jgi:hypothetical protein
MSNTTDSSLITVTSFPERVIHPVPLPHWLAWVILWQVLFLIDYFISWPLDNATANNDVFACIALFFASICVITTYCSKVLVRLFPHLAIFIEEDKILLQQWYQKKLWKSYEGIWPLVTGLAMSAVTIVTILPLIDELTPDNTVLYYYRIGYLAVGFFFLGVALWAQLQVTFLPLELTRKKVKVSINQFAGNGLQALGSAYLKMSLAISVSFLLIVITAMLAPFENNYIVLIWLGIAALLIFGFFLLPQVGIHQVMATEKTNRMAGFANHLEEAMERTLKNPSAENMQRLKELFEVQNHLKAMNDWPFDLNSIWQLLTALIIPIILAAIEIFFKS